ncbi:MAG: 30S ribosomal protein S9 [Candidatus Pacebacteria bacterium]|nr:30S ribosomal protein S9 [Candidatus Paceibacterota bacterium]
MSAKVLGGGLSAQAEAIRLGIARALVKEKASRRGALKSGVNGKWG